MRILCYGVRSVEREIFKSLNERFKFDLVLEESLLDHENLREAEGCEAIMVRGNCLVDERALQQFQKMGLKYILTRTAGYNHIDLNAAKAYGVKVAYVPTYSPNAISELVLTYAMMLTRHGALMTKRTSQGDYRVDGQMFAKEIRNSVVGVIGLGHIGITTAKTFRAIGARVLGYNRRVKSELDCCEQVTLDELLRQSDIISLHIPYQKGVNDQMVNESFLAKMKTGAVLINTSRGELQDIDAVLKRVEAGQLSGFATDVLVNETKYFYQHHPDAVDELDQRIRRLYPQVLITPHIGSFTDTAVSNMVEISYENLREFMETGTSKNQLA